LIENFNSIEIMQQIEEGGAYTPPQLSVCKNGNFFGIQVSNKNEENDKSANFFR